MLLYSRVAPPKIAKKRSRAGCAYCKEKKKKCDEVRPQCSRCIETAQECIYEAVRPRQRRTRERADSVASDNSVQSPRLPTASYQERPPEYSGTEDWRGPTLSPVSKYRDRASQDLMLSLDQRTVVAPDDIKSSLDFTDSSGYDDVEEVIRSEPPVHRNPQRSSSSQAPLLALIAPCPVPSPRLEFSSPVFAEFSDRSDRRALVDHFCNVLSHLIVFREEKGNPFQQLVLPLTKTSPAVMDAIYALASAHLEFRGIGCGEQSVMYHHKAIQGLTRLIEQGNNVDQNELLAGIMLLVYYEVLVQKGRSNIVEGHLKGAMTILNNRSTSRSDPTSVFLERAFRFYDVIAALSFGTAPLAAGPGLSVPTPLAPLDSRGATSPLGSVDALLGMATSLWPIMHRLSTLLPLKDKLKIAIATGESGKVAMVRAEFENTASVIEEALEDWQPEIPPDCALAKDPRGLPEDQAAERARMQSILNNALAYRHSAFVYLYRTIYNHSRSHHMVQQHAHTSLIHCVGTTNNAGPMGALLWPLFVAACEAVGLDDRDLAKRAFKAIDRRQGMTNIERAWTIIQEVWRRADELELSGSMQNHGEEQQSMVRDLWRKVTEDMGVTIVFG